jgi:hypothetical protein
MTPKLGDGTESPFVTGATVLFFPPHARVPVLAQITKHTPSGLFDVEGRRFKPHGNEWATTVGGGWNSPTVRAATPGNMAHYGAAMEEEARRKQAERIRERLKSVRDKTTLDAIDALLKETP